MHRRHRGLDDRLHRRRGDRSARRRAGARVPMVGSRLPDRRPGHGGAPARRPGATSREFGAPPRTAGSPERCPADGDRTATGVRGEDRGCWRRCRAPRLVRRRRGGRRRGCPAPAGHCGSADRPATLPAARVQQCTGRTAAGGGRDGRVSVPGDPAPPVGRRAVAPGGRPRDRPVRRPRDRRGATCAAAGAAVRRCPRHRRRPVDRRRGRGLAGRRRAMGSTRLDLGELHRALCGRHSYPGSHHGADCVRRPAGAGRHRLQCRRERCGVRPRRWHRRHRDRRHGCLPQPVGGRRTRGAAPARSTRPPRPSGVASRWRTIRQARPERSCSTRSSTRSPVPCNSPRRWAPAFCWWPAP